MSALPSRELQKTRSRRVVGYAISRSIDARLPLQRKDRHPSPAAAEGRTHHSDRVR
jgi:hypothetical protein